MTGSLRVLPVVNITDRAGSRDDEFPALRSPLLTNAGILKKGGQVKLRVLPNARVAPLDHHFTGSSVTLSWGLNQQ